MSKAFMEQLSKRFHRTLDAVINEYPDNCTFQEILGVLELFKTRVINDYYDAKEMDDEEEEEAEGFRESEDIRDWGREGYDGGEGPVRSS